MLVNNAATNPVFGPLVDIDEDAWDRIMALNVKGYLLAAQRAARAMAPLGRGGHRQRRLDGRASREPGPGRLLGVEGRR